MLVQLHDLCANHSLTSQDALTNMRSKMVPLGYTPFPFRRNVPETEIDMLRSVVGTCVLRHQSSIERKEVLTYHYLYIAYIYTSQKVTPSQAPHGTTMYNIHIRSV